jgi:hypothetical protein
VTGSLGSLRERTDLEALAWRRYLRACRRAPYSHYDEVEAWAWQRLNRSLLRLHRERKAA